ncbi:MAG: hypothetical protein M0Z94_14965 [Dehalococcoidales bacterium]|nr:hypothetical protein [Dehalococcoidales bacterium]
MSATRQGSATIAKKRPAYSGRLASEEKDGPGYNTRPSATRDEARLTTGYKVEPGTAYGFFTDATVCIGCKACEVACKQWNQIPMDNLGLTGTSYDNTGELLGNTWRHVAFVLPAAPEVPTKRVWPSFLTSVVAAVGWGLATVVAIRAISPTRK